MDGFEVSSAAYLHGQWCI